MIEMAAANRQNNDQGPTTNPFSRRLLIGVGYVLLALAFTWPMPANLWNSFILAAGSDAWLHLWDLWWVRFALLSLHSNPYFTDYIFYPTGLPLTYHSLDLVNALLSIPLQPLGLLTSFNLLLLLNLVASGLAAFWLLRLLGASRIAAFIGGAIFTLTPINSTSVNLAQMDEVSMLWIPLYLGLLFKAGGLSVAKIKPGHWIFALGAGLTLVGSALATWYFTAGLVLLTAAYVLCEVAAQRGNGKALLRPLLVAIGAGVTFAVALSPLLAAMVGARLSGGTWMLPSPSTTIYNSADLLAFFTPLPARLDWRSLYPHGSNVALGWSALALGLLGLAFAGRGQRGKVAIWLVAGAVLIVFALGPELKVAGIETGIAAPYALLNNVPFIGASRQPLRYSACVDICVAVAAAIGFDLLRRHLRGGRLALAFAVAVMAIILFEYLPFGRTLIYPQVPTALAQLGATSDTKGAVLELPYTDPWVAVALYNQTQHEQPIIGGYTSRKYPYPFLDQTPGVAQLIHYDAAPLTDQDILSPAVGATALAAMDYYGVRSVVVHPLAQDGKDQSLRTVLNTLFDKAGVQPQQSGDLQIYTVPQTNYDGPILGLGDGWYALEHGSAGVWRWANQQATLQITSASATTKRYHFEADVYAFQQPRTLIISLDGREISRQAVAVPPGQTISLDLDLTPGLHQITLASLEPAATPSGDSRQLALGFSRIEVK